MTALVLGAVLLAAAGGAVTLLASPLAEWIARAPEIGATIKQKLYVLDRPLAAVRELQPSTCANRPSCASARGSASIDSSTLTAS